MSQFQLEIIALMLPLPPLTEGNWFVLGAIILIILFIIYLAYSYVFRQKVEAQQQIKEQQQIKGQHQTKEEQNEEDQTRN